jgi:hypothetical protein
MVAEQPWAPDEKSSGLVCADRLFDRLSALDKAAGPSGDREGPAYEVGGQIPTPLPVRSAPARHPIIRTVFLLVVLIERP